MKRTLIKSGVAAATLLLLVVASVSTGYADRIVSKLKGPNHFIELSEYESEQASADREEFI
jgi:hypothetical protein